MHSVSDTQHISDVFLNIWTKLRWFISIAQIYDTTINTWPFYYRLRSFGGRGHKSAFDTWLALSLCKQTTRTQTNTHQCKCFCDMKTVCGQLESHTHTHTPWVSGRCITAQGREVRRFFNLWKQTLGFKPATRWSSNTESVCPSLKEGCLGWRAAASLSVPTWLRT